MSNSRTGTINFIKSFIKNLLYLALFIAVWLGLMACEPTSKNVFATAKQEEILGGKIIHVSSAFAKKIIYLALGVEIVKTPHGVSITQQGVCSASAIAPRVLLTAAHCVSSWTSNEVMAILSINPFKENLYNEKEWISVKKIKIHENYKSFPHVENDIALVYLTKDLEPERISKLATVENTKQKMEFISIGFGVTDLDKTDNQANVNYAQLYYVMKSVNNYNPKNLFITINQQDQKGLCSGDSGSPGYIYDFTKKEFLILGIASHVTSAAGAATAGPTVVGVESACHGYGIYMNVLPIRKWIISSMAANNIK